MKIKVIGSGCPTCKRLYEIIIKLKDKSKINAEVEYSKDINELIELGVFGAPALIIDGKVVNVGMLENEDKLLEIIKKAK